MIKLKLEIGIKVIVFLLIFIMVLSLSGKLFVPFSNERSNQNRTFYHLEKNSVDVLIVGSSTLLVGLSPLELWDNYGLVAYTRGGSVQIPEITYLNIKEAYKTQKPKVVVMGITMLFGEYDVDEYEPFVRGGMDVKKFSWDKLEVIREIVDQSNSQNTLDYIFPLLRYHDRWKEIEWEDVEHLKYKYDYMRGQYPRYKVEKIESRAEVNKAISPEKYNVRAWEYYKKAIDYCKMQGTDVVVVALPDDRWTYGRYLTAKELLDEMDVDYVDFNLEEAIADMDLDWDVDFYDAHHLNPLGAKKATDYLGQFLVENYTELLRYESDVQQEELLNRDLELYKKDLVAFREKYNL